MIYKKKALPSMRATRACSLLATRAWRKFLELNLYKYITERQQCAAFRKFQKRTKSLHPTAKHMPPVSARGTVCTAHLCAVFALFLGKKGRHGTYFMVTIPGIKGTHNVLKLKLSPEMNTCSSFYAVRAIAAMEALTGRQKSGVHCTVGRGLNGRVMDIPPSSFSLTLHV